MIAFYARLKTLQICILCKLVRASSKHFQVNSILSLVMLLFSWNGQFQDWIAENLWTPWHKATKQTFCHFNLFPFNATSMNSQLPFQEMFPPVPLELLPSFCNVPHLIIQQAICKVSHIPPPFGGGPCPTYQKSGLATPFATNTGGSKKRISISARGRERRTLKNKMPALRMRDKEMLQRALSPLQQQVDRERERGTFWGNRMVFGPSSVVPSRGKGEGNFCSSRQDFFALTFLTSFPRVLLKSCCDFRDFAEKSRREKSCWKSRKTRGRLEKCRIIVEKHFNILVH